MTSKSKLSNLFKGKSVHDLPSFTTPITKHEWTKNDDKLMEAVENQNVKKVLSLLTKKNLNPTKRGPLGRSAFHVACASGNINVLDLILPRSLDVNVTTIQGSTALQWAASKGHTYTVEKLLQTSANVNQRDSNEMTALHHACAGPHLNCVKLLLAGNADPHAKEMGGKTPLVYAAHRGNLEICQCLLDRGADINSQDRDNVTALMLAAKEGHEHICEFLLSKGANPNLKDGAGNTAMKYAASLSVHDVLVAKTEKQSDGTQEEKNVQNQLNVESQKDASNVEVHQESVNSSKSPTVASHTIDYNTEKAYQKLKEEHDQLNEEYSSLARENLKLRDKLQSSQQKLTELRERMSVEIKGLKEELQQEKLKATQVDNLHTAPTAQGTESSSRTLCDTEGTSETQNSADTNLLSSDVEKMTTLNNELQQRIVILESENFHLKEKVESSQKLTVSAMLEGPSPASEDNKETQSEIQKQLEAEVSELKKALETVQTSSEALTASQKQAEEWQQKNAALENQIRESEAEVVSLQKALEEAKAEGSSSDAQRLDALLERSKNIEDVSFDEEGFVEGRDMTKEEFLQGQNQQLRTQCNLLSQELEKLRTTFDAILKAGDNLQADYDQQATEKESLQYDLELSLKEKAELASENEFLLQDNNELHESLKQLVHELERMQDKLQAAQSAHQAVQEEITELKQQKSKESKEDVEGSELSRLTEERCTELEASIGRMQCDNGLLVEKVQQLNETVERLTEERAQMSAELEEVGLACRQQEGLQQDYNQLEVDFAELLKEKQALEQQLLAHTDGEGSSTESAAALGHEQKDQEKQELETVVSGLSRLNVELEKKVSRLQERLEKAQTMHNGEDHQNKLRTEASREGNNNLIPTSAQAEIINLKKQVAKLQAENEEWEKRYGDTVTTYRTHLLSAVQGHMDPDVKDALYQIIELRSMEQFC